jgi:hypothetical protein
MSIRCSERSNRGDGKVAAPLSIAAHIASHAVDFLSASQKAFNLPLTRKTAFRSKPFIIGKEESEKTRSQRELLPVH